MGWQMAKPISLKCFERSFRLFPEHIIDPANIIVGALKRLLQIPNIVANHTAFQHLGADLAWWRGENGLSIVLPNPT